MLCSSCSGCLLHFPLGVTVIVFFLEMLVMVKVDSVLVTFFVLSVVVLREATLTMTWRIGENDFVFQEKEIS